MARYKVLKGVAYNLAQSFASAMNYVEGDHATGHLLRRARELGEPVVSLDLLTGVITPPDFADSPGGRALATYSRWFPELVSKNETSLSLIRSASLSVVFDLSQAVPFPYKNYNARIVAYEPGSPYDLTVTIADDRGREWTATEHSWAYPARHCRQPKWWHFWKRGGTPGA